MSHHHDHGPARLDPASTPAALRRIAALSILAALVTIVMKSAAFLVSGSVGLLSDALESGVNLLAAGTAYFSLWYASRPADPNHTYGHEKIEFFSSGLEGALVVVAGVGTAWMAVDRLLRPQPLENLGLGMAIATAAAGVNLGVGLVLLRAAKKYGSPVLEADGHHLMSDVWTTVGVLVGLGLVMATRVPELDGILAAGIGLHITLIGFGLVRKSFDGLMDHAVAPDEVARIRDAIRAALPAGTDFHLLRTRRAGRRTFADFHVLVDGSMTVRAAHRIADALETALRGSLPDLEVTTHIEPIDEPASWEAARLAEIGEAPTPP